MTTRRNFLKGGTAAATGIVFCSCGLLEHAHAQPGGRTLPVAVNGKKVKTIDVHCALPLPRSRRAAEPRRRGRGPVAAGPGRRRGLHRDRQAVEGHGRAGRRHGSAVDQSLLVRPRSRARRADRQDPEREAGRALRLQAGPLRRLRLAHPAGARSRGAGARDRGEEAGPEGRRDRRRRGRRGILRSQVPSGVGQGGGAGRAPVHPSARRAGARQATVRQRLAGQYHRQSAGDHDRALAPDLRGHARPLPRSESHRRAWRRLSGVLRRPLRSCLHGRSRRLQSQGRAEEEADRVSQAALFRLADLHARSVAPSRGPGRRPARSCWAATIPIRGSSTRWTTSSPRPRSATTRRWRSSARRPRRS